MTLRVSTGGRAAHPDITRLLVLMRLPVVITVCMLFIPAAARADVVLDWNVIATNTALASPNPFAQARFLAITQLAVFEAVNAITGRYEPYLGTIDAPDGASADAAAIAAAHTVLKRYFPASGPALDTARASSLAAIPDGAAKTNGIATGEAAAEEMIRLRANDGSTPAMVQLPGPLDPGVWQATPSCPRDASGTQVGALAHWRNVAPFGIPRADKFLSAPPPKLTSGRYTRDYNEVMTVGRFDSMERPSDRADVARFYAAASPSFIANLMARQVAFDRGDSPSENARALALLNMAISDSLVASFNTKYTYNFWRPETAIRAGETDGNPRTVGDATFAPFITTPCFPAYPSNHASGSYGASEVLLRLYGNRRHSIVVAHPRAADPYVASITLNYSRFSEMTDDVDDARVYGGIHFRFDQEAGARLGRDVGSYVYKHNLRRVNNNDQDKDK